MKHRVVRLGQVVDINPSTKATGSADDLVAFLAMADISEEGRVTSVQQRPLADVQKGYTIFQAGDVLLAKITPCFENGKAAFVESLPTQVGFGSTEFHVLRPTEEVDPKFLFHLVWNQSFRRLGASRMTGSAGQKRVPVAFLADYEFTLPPLHEQRRIATILEKADSLRSKRLEAMRLTDELLRSKFEDTFGDPYTNTKGFPATSLGELVKLKSGNFLPSHEMAGKGGVHVYGGNGVNGEHDAAMFEEPKLVIGRVGAYCGAVHLTKPRSWITDNALYASEISPLVRIEYLAFALAQANLNQYSSQSGQPLVSASRLYPVMLMLPPLSLQDAFLNVLEKSERFKALQVKSLESIGDMCRSLAEKYFSQEQTWPSNH